MRARDMFMAAKIDSEKRIVYLTGSIDENDIIITPIIKTPAGGLWTVIKAETNLTEETWVAWQIRFPTNTKIAFKEEGWFACRQFEKIVYNEEINAVIFMDGEVRPGEPILKVFTIDIGDQQEIMPSHHRLVMKTPDDIRNAQDGFGMNLPELRFRVPIVE